LVLAGFLVSSVPLAADQALELPVPLFVTHSGTDDVGRMLAYAVREELRTSRGLPLVSELPKAAVVLHIISVESSCSQPGVKSAISFVAVVNNSSSTFLTARVVDLGAAEVANEAKSIVAKIDTEIAAWRSRGR
jgi:hypothetical protein